MKDLVPAVAIGKADGQIVLDLNKEEDNYGNADLPIAMIPRTGEVLLMQMDGHMTMEEFDLALEYGKKACQMVYDVQKDALRRRYAVQGGNVESEDEAPQSNGPEA